MKNKNFRYIGLFAVAVILAGGSGVALAADKVPVYPEKDAFFGTTHAHSSWSPDAFGLGMVKVPLSVAGRKITSRPIAGSIWMKPLNSWLKIWEKKSKQKKYLYFMEITNSSSTEHPPIFPLL
jgi:hypothetical protein